MQDKKMDKKIISISSLTYLEILIVVCIMGIILGGALPLITPFTYRQELEASVVKLFQDLRQAHQFSRILRDEYSYYGIKFYDGLSDDNRAGYKILLFCQTDAGGTCTEDPIVPFNPSGMVCNDSLATSCNFIKSSESADNPEFLENTFFSKGVTFDAASEFGADGTIIFNPDGSATTDGETLLGAGNDEIILKRGSYTRRITISALTGYVSLEN